MQLFDSWAGALSAARTTPASCSRTAPRCSPRWPTSDVPKVHFGVGTGELLGLMGEAGADVVGVDWRVPLDAASGRVGPDGACRATWTRRCCWPTGRWSRPRYAGCSPRAAPPAGHVFNLGHGVLPETDPTVLTRVVELVHSVPR